MEAFPDRTHVWLRIRENDGDYLYASEDGEDIACTEDAHGALHGAWAVHRLVRDDTDYVLFHSASYGRYLAKIEADAEADVEYDYRTGQCTYDSPEQVNVLFQARRVEDGTDDIFLSNAMSGDWFHSDDADTPMHWMVEAIPPRLLPPELPDPPQPILPPAVRFTGRICLWRRAGPVLQPQAVFRRRINYERADDQGNFNPQQWRVLQQFEGQSVYNLRRDLAAALGEGSNDLGITLCVWGGLNGRWTPLVIDLPPNEETMNIVVLTTGSPAALALRHPDVDAQ